MIIEAIYALFATLGFGVIFNIRGKKLIFAAIGGGMGWFFYKLGLLFGFSDITSLFLGAIALSSYGEILARIFKTPVTTFVICAIIPLVPGSGIYFSLLSSIQGDVDKALELGLSTLLSAGSIAIGVMLTSTITRFINHLISKNKKLV